jgi:hypothetical protein
MNTVAEPFTTVSDPGPDTIDQVVEGSNEPVPLTVAVRFTEPPSLTVVVEALTATEVIVGAGGGVVVEPSII